MKSMKALNIDGWRTLSEPLFNAYIHCYRSLADDPKINPKKMMVESLKKFEVLGEVTEENYNSAYTIARELGIFYNVKENFFLSELALKYKNGTLSYSDYLKHYALNTEFLIADEVIHPFKHLIDEINLGKNKIDDLVLIKELNPRGGSVNKFKDHFGRFLSRCVQANLVRKDNNIYSLVKPYKLIKESINETNLSPHEFKSKYIGPSNQKNVVEMISKDINPCLLYTSPSPRD